MSPVDERRLVRRFLAGDEQAFELLHDRYAPAMYQFALRLVGYREPDAEDVVQEAWLRASVTATHYVSPSRGVAGQWSVGFGRCRSAYRSRGHRPPTAWTRREGGRSQEWQRSWRPAASSGSTGSNGAGAPLLCAMETGSCGPRPGAAGRLPVAEPLTRTRTRPFLRRRVKISATRPRLPTRPLPTGSIAAFGSPGGPKPPPGRCRRDRLCRSGRAGRAPTRRRPSGQQRSSQGRSMRGTPLPPPNHALRRLAHQEGLVEAVKLAAATGTCPSVSRPAGRAR